MSAAKKKTSQLYPMKKTADMQEMLRSTKIQIEQYKDKLQKSIIDNPKTAKKAALLIQLWIENKKLKRK